MDSTGAPNAILAINSLDRYITGKANQPTDNALIAEYEGIDPPSNNFAIQSPGALIYGYINRLVVSQIQLQCNIPTIVPNRNNRFFIALTATNVLYPITMPYGYYTPAELAAMLQIQIAAVPALAAGTFTVTYNPQNGFVFRSTAVVPLNFYFPDTEQILNTPGETNASVKVVLKAYKVLGMTLGNADIGGPGISIQISSNTPNFLYTPYIDFYSDVLTNYQNVKDTNTSVAKPKGLIARVYLSGSGGVQGQRATSALGSEPFVVTADLNSPKIIRWEPNVAVPSIDFQLLDCYGDFIPGPSPFDNIYYAQTEFQMTLLCVEGE
jgi:hypothetical protein